MKRLLIILTVIIYCNTLISSPQQLTTSPKNQYHPKWKPGTDDQIMGYTLNHDDMRDLLIFPIDDPESEEELPIDLNGDFAFSWSPDGKKMVFDVRVGEDLLSNLWIYDLETSTYEQLTFFTQFGAFHPAWSPNGDKIAFTRGLHIWTIKLSNNLTQQFTFGDHEDWHPAWSPDGEEISFTSDRDGSYDIWCKNIVSYTLKKITNNPDFNDDRAIWSPDGNFITFASNRSGNEDIWIQSIDGSFLKQITYNPSFDSHPDWSFDGDKLAFASLRNGNFDIFTIDISDIYILDIDESSNSLKSNSIDLIKNYPNPFNPSTTLEFKVDTNSIVKVDIYNSKGELIDMVVDRSFEQGVHHLIIDGKNYESGIYFVQFTTPNKTTTQRITLVK